MDAAQTVDQELGGSVEVGDEESSFGREDSWATLCQILHVPGAEAEVLRLEAADNLIAVGDG